MPEPVSEQQRTFGHYDVESVLGKGAMGMVYLARDRRIGRRVALKTVHIEERFDDDSEAREFYKRLQREAELCGALQHPNIVTLYEPGYENDVIAWLATEYVDGESLRERMRRRKPLPVREAVRIGEDILRGLVYAHGKGIVHRDIKPANILLTSGGEAKIADFGIARPTDSNLTAVGEMLGTPSYMSPEQVRCSPVTTRSDLFSVGSVMYEMIAGVKAFGAPDVTSILRNVVEAHPKRLHEINSEVTPALSQVITRLLAKSPDDRYASASVALEALQEARAEIEATDQVAQDLAAPPSEATLSTPRPRPLRENPRTNATDFGLDDATPPLASTSSPSFLRRRVPTFLFFATILVCLGTLAAGAAAIRARTDSSPTVFIPPAKLAEYNAKLAAMGAADRLYKAGKYPESIVAYDYYLARYPNSIKAREERAEAILALEAMKAEQRMTVTATRPKTPDKAKDSEKKPGFWRRIFGK